MLSEEVVFFVGFLSEIRCIFIMDSIYCDVCAGLTWLMVYRTSKYKKLKSEVEKQSKKCTHGFY